MKHKIHIGTSGFHYKDWKGKFYPEKLRPQDWLEYYSQHFETVELNASFYRMPTEQMVKNWIRKTPEHFLFTVKASRIITHYLRLQYCEEPLKKFLQMIKPFEKSKKLACLLYQLPPNYKKNLKTLESFLKILPKKYLHVFEFRHESWNDEETFNILKKYNVTYCIVSSGKLKSHCVLTSDTTYIRFHGPGDIYASKYPDEELKKWARTIKKFLKNKKTVFAYFNNDVNAYAVENSKKLKKLIEKNTKKNI
jgi:uncharacterized protein YecE (DUF72 family)